jgi:hypothetical protein
MTATAAAKLSATGSLPWYSGGLSIALALLQLSSLLPRYKGNGSLGSTVKVQLYLVLDMSKSGSIKLT